MGIVEHGGTATAATMAGDRPRVLVIGIGDDGPASLPPAILARIHAAELLVGGRRHLAMFEDVVAGRLVIADGLDRVLAQIEDAAPDGRVVVLATGDPCFFGIGPLLARRLGRDGVEIVPGVSAVALAFARLGIGWQDARVVSAHGRPLAPAISAARGATKLAVLTDDVNTPVLVAAALLEAGADDADAWVFEHLGGPEETATAARLSGLAGRSFAPLNLLAVPHLAWTAEPRAEVGAHGTVTFGRPERAFAHTASMITKPEVRALGLSKLGLRRGGVLWDVGAGSGSLGIEAADLVPNLAVYAVERAPTQIEMLTANIQAFGVAGRVQIVAGEAPAALAGLPAPDAVFVGGSGGSLAAILDAAARRLAHDGRIVVSLVTFEHIAATLGWATGARMSAEVVQVGIARGSEIVGLTRLQAENPVTLVTLRR